MFDVDATAVAERLIGPWGSVVVRQIDTTVIPWVAVGVEASGGFDRDQRRLGYVAGAVLEEGAAGRMRAILASFQERRDRRHTSRFAKLVKNSASLTRNVVTERCLRR